MIARILIDRRSQAEENVTSRLGLSHISPNLTYILVTEGFVALTFFDAFGHLTGLGGIDINWLDSLLFVGTVNTEYNLLK